MREFAFLRHDGPIAIAHRGGMAEAPENTMDAFQYVAKLGYHYVELDVRATADGELFVWHGPPDSKRDESPLNLKTLSAQEHRNLPRLADVLKAFPNTRYQIDPKHQLAVEPLARVIAEAGAVERVSIGSFSDKRIKQTAQLIYEKNGKWVATAMGPYAISRLLLRSYTMAGRTWHSSFQSVMPPAKYITPRFIKAAHAGNLKVIPWTINEPGEMTRLLDMQVDGLITDRPTLLKKVLQQRGQWHQA